MTISNRRTIFHFLISGELLFKTLYFPIQNKPSSTPPSRGPVVSVDGSRIFIPSPGRCYQSCLLDQLHECTGKRLHYFVFVLVDHTFWPEVDGNQKRR